MTGQSWRATGPVAVVGLLLTAGACGDSQLGLPCDTIGEEQCEEQVLIRCNGEEWYKVADCDHSCVDGPGTMHDALSGDETWACADSPHVVEAVLTVPDGATLTVETGAEVRIVRGSRIDTTPSSQLVAAGVEGAEVLFTSDDNTQGGFGGLNQGGLNLFAGPDAASVLDYVIIERAVHGLGVLGLDGSNQAPAITNSTFRDNEHWGILVRGCVGDVAVPDFAQGNNRFYENGDGPVSECQ